MDPVATLKRALEFDWKLCIFCQKSNKPKDDGREATSYNKNNVLKIQIVNLKQLNKRNLSVRFSTRSAFSY